MRNAASLALFAYALLSAGVYAANGALHPASFPFVAAAVGCVAAAAWIGHKESQILSRRLVAGVLGLFFALGLRPPGEYLRGGYPVWHALLQLAMALLVASTFFTRRWHPWRRYALLAAFALEGVLVLRASPLPRIDVFHFQQDGAAALGAGRNPYRVRYRNVYDASESRRFYGTERPRLAYPYPPASALMTLPAYVGFHDVRYTMLAAMLLTALLTIAIARRLGRPRDDPWIDLLVGLQLLQPRALFVLEQAWTEPVVAALVYLAVYLALAGRPAIQAIAMGLLLASKQYVVLFLPALKTHLRASWPVVLGALGVGAIVTVPFALWDLPAFVDHVLRFQLRQPFRADALSWPGLVYALAGWRAPAWTPFAVALIAIGVAYRRCPRTPFGFALGSSLVVTTFVFSAKQAFANYYHLAGALMLLCVVVAERASLTSSARSAPSVASRATSTQAGAADSRSSAG